MRARIWAFACLLGAGWHWHDEPRGPGRCEWSQWGQSAAHDGQACASGQNVARELAHVVIDPFVAQEALETGFDALLVHYQVPLSDDEGNVFILQKAGTYVELRYPPGSGEPFPCGPDAMSSQIWTEKAMRWHHGHLQDRWTFFSDYKPPPTGGEEPMFQPALTERWLYVAGAGGSVFKVDKNTGLVHARIKPFGPTLDPTTFVYGGLTTDPARQRLLQRGEGRPGRPVLRRHRRLLAGQGDAPRSRVHGRLPHAHPRLAGGDRPVLSDLQPGRARGPRGRGRRPRSRTGRRRCRRRRRACRSGRP